MPSPGSITIIPCLIPAGRVISNGINLGTTSFAPQAIIMPPIWDPPNILLTFRTSFDNGVTFVNIYDPSGAELTATVIPNAVLIMQRQLEWLQWIKLRSGSGRSPVLQNQACNFQIVMG